MSFYQSISDQYDAIFPVNAAEMSFVATLLENKRKILDIGCGTGNKTVHFKMPGNEITAVDADTAMIERARRDNAQPGITYEVMDMRRIGEAFAPGAFDAALCLGNTLVHLPDPALINAMLCDTSASLDDSGLCVIQILNYDRILDNDVRELPLLETDAFRFSRFYKWQGGKMLFVTELFLKDSGETVKNAVPLYPLRKAELAASLASAGFTRVAYHGSYDGGPLADDSFVLIAAACKRS
ncbi:MAG: Glycine/sarcosine N-methyltransferase [Desulfovibrio sp.]